MKLLALRLSYLLLVSLLTLTAAPAFSKSAEKKTTCISSTILTQQKKKIPLNLEVVHTPKSREKGLMHRTSMGACDGIVFLFKQPKPQFFWMKDTHIPLDILFINPEFQVIYIGEGIPLSLKAIGPDMPIASVIELKKGSAAASGISVGDTVSYDPKILQYAAE